MIFDAKSNLVGKNAVRFGLWGATGFTLPFLHMAWGTCTQAKAHKYQYYYNKLGVCVQERRRIVPSAIRCRICCQKLDRWRQCGFFGL